MKIFKNKEIKLSETRIYLSFIIKLIIILSIIFAGYRNLWQVVSINSLLLILTFIPDILKKSYKIEFPTEFEWLLLFFVIISFFIGNTKGIIVPLFFGAIMNLIGFMILLMLYSTNQIKKNYLLIILFAFNFAIVLGFGLEFLKYYLKLILGQEISAGLYSYMMKNMTFIIIGDAISCIIGYIYMKNKNSIIGKFVERFKRSNPEMFQKSENEEEIIDLIKKGENENLEFKSTLRVNIHTNEFDNKVEHSVLKTINAFLNSNGGTILIGISDKGEITGIEKDRFENTDKFNLHFSNLIKDKIGKKYSSLIKSYEIKIKDKIIIKLEIKKSDKEIFLKISPKEEEFYIRSGPSSVQLKGSELIEYIRKKFEKK